jgi:hypothetical protein
VAIVHDAVKEMIRAHLTLVHVFHVYASADTPWVAQSLSHYTPISYGRIASVSMAHDTTKFGDSICPVCVSTFQMLVHSDPTDTGLNRLRRVLPPWSFEYQIRPLPFLLIQYSPFSPNCPTRSRIMPIFSKIHLNHIEPPMSRGPYLERLSTTRLLPIAYTTKHSILSFPFFIG